MIQIYAHLYLGHEYDYEAIQDDPGWWVVHARKGAASLRSPGLQRSQATQSHPKFLLARRGSKLMLNLMDAIDPAVGRKYHLILHPVNRRYNHERDHRGDLSHSEKDHVTVL